MPVRRYSNVAPPLGLSVGINTTAPTLTVSSTTGYPEPPFILAIERGTPDEEVCLCTAKTGTTFTVTRGYDDTSGKNHDPGDFVEHVHSALEFREANIPRLTTAERDTMFSNEVWEGRLIWNSTIGRFEWRDTQGPVDQWADLVPAGVVVPYAGSSVANGWLMCQGQLISRTDYNRLFAAIGTAYGPGDGSTTFALPDMRRRFPLGRHTVAPYNVLGATGGLMDHKHTNDPTASGGSHQHTMEPTGMGGGHDHAISFNTNGATKGVYGGHTFDGTADVAAQALEHIHHVGGDTNPVANHQHGISTSHSAGGHTHNVVDTGTANPPYTVLNFIIRY